MSRPQICVCRDAVKDLFVTNKPCPAPWDCLAGRVGSRAASGEMFIGVHTHGRAEHRPDRVRGEQGSAACSPQQNPSLPSSPRKTIQSIWGPVVGWGVAEPRAPWPTGPRWVSAWFSLGTRSSTLNSNKSAAMSLAFDEYGRPFIIIRVRRSRKRLNVSVSLFVRDRFEFQRFHSFSVRPFPGVGGVHACRAIRRQSATVFSVARVAT